MFRRTGLQSSFYIYWIGRSNGWHQFPTLSKRLVLLLQHNCWCRSRFHGGYKMWAWHTKKWNQFCVVGGEFRTRHTLFIDLWIHKSSAGQWQNTVNVRWKNPGYTGWTPTNVFSPILFFFKGLYNHQPTHVPNPDAHMPPIHVCAPCDAQLVIHAMPTMHLNVKDKLNPRALWHIVIQIPSTIHYLIVHSRRKRDCSRSMTHRTQERPFFVTKHVIWFDHSHKEVL